LEEVSLSAEANREALFQYVLRIGDNALILGQRLSEWCGHAPILEEDIALANIALDQIGLARLTLSYAGEVEGRGRDEDALAFLRSDPDFRNLLLVEQPNLDFGHTITRQFLYDAFHVGFFDALRQSSDDQLAAIAGKAVKEVTYHLKHSGDWVIRLGDGTDESRRRAQRALDELWTYTGEMLVKDPIDEALSDVGVAVDRGEIRAAWSARVDAVLAEATLDRPRDGPMLEGGRDGAMHSEHLGHLLSEMQFMQRRFPESKW
jgi:ring-1,2-phenylacetyl-CoA epoxidase subunit PaaC